MPRNVRHIRARDLRSIPKDLSGWRIVVTRPIRASASVLHVPGDDVTDIAKAWPALLSMIRRREVTLIPPGADPFALSHAQQDARGLPQRERRNALRAGPLLPPASSSDDPLGSMASEGGEGAGSGVPGIDDASGRHGPDSDAATPNDELRALLGDAIDIQRIEGIEREAQAAASPILEPEPAPAPAPAPKPSLSPAQAAFARATTAALAAIDEHTPKARIIEVLRQNGVDAHERSNKTELLNLVADKLKEKRGAK